MSESYSLMYLYDKHNDELQQSIDVDNMSFPGVVSEQYTKHVVRVYHTC